jgi:hypothetical protein
LYRSSFLSLISVSFNFPPAVSSALVKYTPENATSIHPKMGLFALLGVLERPPQNLQDFVSDFYELCST